MSGFERSSGDSAWTDAEEHVFPDDFSRDEAEFACELRELFAPEREEMPPLYVQTLLDDVRHAVVEPGYEQKLSYRVFQRLNLPRAPLLPRHRFGFSWAVVRDSLERVSRPIAAAVSAAAIFMMLTIVLTTPAFAAGMRLLLGHTGVMQVQSYPAHVRPSASMATPTTTHETGNPPVTAVDWFGPTVDAYDFQGAYLESPLAWTDGPMVELLYARSGHSDGTGLLDVREFRAATSLKSVLQVVAYGSSTPVMVGDRPGVYVDGSWTHYGKYPTWQSGIKSELIFERNGLIYWIVADQRDGTGQDQLVAAAQQLQSVSLTRLWVDHPSLRLVEQQLQGALAGTTDNEVLALVPAGQSSEGGQASFVRVTSGYPSDS